MILQIYDFRFGFDYTVIKSNGKKITDIQCIKKTKPAKLLVFHVRRQRFEAASPPVITFMFKCLNDGQFNLSAFLIRESTGLYKYTLYIYYVEYNLQIHVYPSTLYIICIGCLCFRQTVITVFRLLSVYL